MSDFTKEEIHKLKQLVCDHQTIPNEYLITYSCSCCGKYDEKCVKCGLIIEHECNDHDTEDGYCLNCR